MALLAACFLRMQIRVRERAEVRASFWVRAMLRDSFGVYVVKLSHLRHDRIPP